MSNLVIVESPAKSKTIQKFLGAGFKVLSSYGHVRDLPKSKMGVDIDNDFTPEYTIPKDKQKVITALKKEAKGKDLIFLATDEDREGEAIAWHLLQALKPAKEKVKRITFGEITKSAITKAVKAPRDIDLNLVDAQQSRRILDRLVGYELSPFLWKKVRRGLSAGRVQSVAVRLIVEREREIEKFKPDEYWTLGAELTKHGKKETFLVLLKKKDGKAVPRLGIKTKGEAEKIEGDLKKSKYTVSDIRKREVKKTPPPPYTTSTLQQDAAHKLGFSAKQTMRLAQQLYEGIPLGKLGSFGLITYMRTDSLHLAEEATGKAKEYIANNFGADYALSTPRRYKTKSKGAQEAHEAIRPTYPDRPPELVKEFLDSRQLRLYRLIWQRLIACQMAEARLNSITADITTTDEKYLLRATGSTILFDGFTRLYTEKGSKVFFKEVILPELSTGESLDLKDIKSEQHFTQPPARFTEATLVKALEENGIGRPSTYAPTISTVQDRGYVEKKEDKKLHPTEVGVVVNDVLVEHFPEIVDIKFTASMEENLDKIARGEKEWVPIIKDFYKPFKKHLKQKEKTVNKKDITEEKTDEKCEKCGKPMVIKLGRYGKFLACTGYPECKTTKPLGEEKELHKEHSGIKCELCGKEMLVRRGKFGPFLGCSGYPDCKGIKPIEKKTGAKCPKCKKGEIIEKKSKKGRTFYACNRYPDCEHSMWQKPTGEKCPECSSLLTFAAKGKIVCSNKTCSFEKEQE